MGIGCATTSKPGTDRQRRMEHLLHLAGGFGNISPAPNIAIRGNGTAAWFGWPANDKIEELVQRMVRGARPAAQQKICEAMQVAFWQNPTFVPLGMYDQPTAFQKYLQDVPEGWPQFYGLKKVV